MFKSSVFTLGLCLSAGPAFAGLEICNGTDQRHSIAIGYKQGEGWASEGWWRIEPGACATPIKGDLTHRYYYFRATHADRTFADENYMFCTDSAVFTISGDSDCAARGYARTGFRRIDTGISARSHSFTFDASMSRRVTPQPAPKAEAPKPAAPQPAAPQANQPGQWGEPYYSADAVFQDCVTETEAPFCTFHADGTKFFVYRDGRTPDYIFASLSNHWPGTPIEVEGDLEAIYDRTADVVLRSAVPRAWKRWDSILDQLQGGWYNTGNPEEIFTILGSELTYDGGSASREYLSLSSYCDGAEGGEFLVRTEEETGEQYCYGIEALEQFRLVLMYLPRANFHEYRKLD